MALDSHSLYFFIFGTLSSGFFKMNQTHPPPGGNKNLTTCNTETEPSWVAHMRSIFCSASPVPKGSRLSGVRFNAMTRLVFYITILLIVCGFPKWWLFLLCASVLLLTIHFVRKNSGLTENFAILSPSLLNTNMEDDADFYSFNTKFTSNTPNGKSLLTPYTNLAQPLSTQASALRNDTAANQLRLMPLKSANITNVSGLGDYVEQVFNTKKEPGKRDPQAGIQYFSPYVGVNRKTMMQPIIGPRITDIDYWGKQATVRSDINSLHVVDVTNEAINVTDMATIPDRYPNAQPAGLGQIGYPLALPIAYENRVGDGVWNMNPVGKDPDVGYWPSSADYYNNQSVIDYNHNVLPTFQNPDSYPTYNVENMLKNQPIPGLNTNSTPNYQPYLLSNTFNAPTLDVGITNNMALAQEGVKIKEGYHYVDLDAQPQPNAQPTTTLAPVAPVVPVAPVAPVTPVAPVPSQTVGSGIPQANPDTGAVPVPTSTLATQPGVVPPPQLMNYYSQPPLAPLVSQFNNMGAKGVFGGKYSEMGRVPPGQNVQIPPVTDQLLYASPTYSFTDDYFRQPNTKLFLQDVQPKLYSYVVDQTPINSNVGIAYAPQNPPRVLDQISSNTLKTPLYSRIDPQLVRKDGTPGQQAQQPTRTDYSAEYSNFQAPQGSINFEDIYNPTFTSYGDPYRSYADVNLGQVQYYYADVDAYRMSNFISRSNVDFVDFRTPQGQIWPEYARTASLDSVRPHVENQVAADELFHREDLMSLQMDKANRMNYQLRHAPLRNGFHSGFGFGSSM